LMGAVNCIVRQGRELVGENTDGKGFMQSLRPVIDPAGKRAVLLGAGGAGRAIGVELALAGVAHLTIVNRTPDRGQPLAELIQQRTSVPTEYVPWVGDYVVPADTEILVQATSIGLNDGTARVPVKLDQLSPGTVAADVIASPPDTHFLRQAQAQQCRILDGLGMIVNQGAIGFELWTGIAPDLTILRDAVEEYLEA